ncbi:hypothetical protein DRN86_03095 [Candidatus Geothermarchaeota archaeon]|nr:MAG: hypothetical protein DRN86_03095 [Candidatus Geothermarchaeota archaeon]
MLKYPFKLVKDVMVRNVYTLSPEDTLLEAVKLMSDKKIGSVVITEGKKVRGIITTADIVRLASKNLNFRKVKLKSVMSKPVITLGPNASIEEAIKTMKIRNIRHLPIVENNFLIGIVSERDLVWHGIINTADFHLLMYLLYAKSVGDILKTGAIIPAPKFMGELTDFLEKRGLVVREGIKPQEALSSIKKFIRDMGIRVQIDVNEVERNKFVVEVRGYDRTTLDLLRDSFMIEPYTLVAASLLGKITGKKVKIKFSSVSNDVFKTEITLE